MPPKLRFNVISTNSPADLNLVLTCTSALLSADEILHLANYKAKLLFASGLLRARDLVTLDLEASTIMVRRLCVVVSLPPLRGIIVPNQMLLLDQSIEGDAAWATQVRARIQELARASSMASFELMAIEATFAVVAAHFQALSARVREQAQSTLAQVKNSRTSAVLDLLRNSQSDVQALSLKVSSCRNAIDALLKEDEYLIIAFAHMLADPERFMNNDLPANTDCEMILESAMLLFNSILMPLRTEMDALRNAEFDVKRALALAHNEITFLSVIIQALIGACAVGTMVSGAFAMNLISFIPQANMTAGDYPEVNSLFWTLASVMFFGPIVFVSAIYGKIKRLARA